MAFGRRAWFARSAIRSSSIPHVTLIDFDFVLLANSAELLLKGHRPMVFGLTLDVIDHLRHGRLADRERAVAGLPMEIGQITRPLLDPL